MSFRLPSSVVIRAAFALVVAAVVIPAVPDVDLWGHTQFGGDIVRSGALHSRDTYSFTSDIPWINHEWLAEVVMFLAYASAGGTGLMGLRLILMAVMCWIVWRTLRSEGVSAQAAFALVTILALLTYPRTEHVRPQLFSLVAFAALLYVLMRQERRPTAAALVCVPVVMLVWANFHGGFIVGFLPIGLWTFAIVVDRRVPVSTRALSATVPVAALLATLVHPHGVDLWRFLWRTVGINRSDIVEWWSMANAGIGVLALWIVTAALAVMGVVRHERPLWPQLHRIALVAGLALISFRVSRLDAFFAIAVVMCFGKPLSGFWARRDASTPPRHLAPAAAGLVLATAVGTAGLLLMRTAPARNGCVDTVWWLPEQAATAFVEHNGLRGRMITFFSWGEYILWQFAPEIQISSDGRRETIYSDSHINGHLQLYAGTEAGLAYAATLDADYAWLPKWSPAVAALRQRGWTQIFVGERSAILTKPGDQKLDRGYTMPESTCYPGPHHRPSPLSSGFWNQL